VPTGITHTTFWEALEQYPPYKVRLLAKRSPREPGPQGMSDEEVAFDSGLSVERIRQISTMTDWNAMTLEEVHRLFVGCRFDPTNPTDRRRFHQYEYVCMKRKALPFQYLRNHPKWESQFLPLIHLMKRQKNSSTRSDLTSSARVNSAA
jgi:hypothetical protein